MLTAFFRHAVGTVIINDELAIEINTRPVIGLGTELVSTVLWHLQHARKTQSIIFVFLALRNVHRNIRDDTNFGRCQLVQVFVGHRSGELVKVFDGDPLLQHTQAARFHLQVSRQVGNQRLDFFVKLGSSGFVDTGNCLQKVAQILLRFGCSEESITRPCRRHPGRVAHLFGRRRIAVDGEVFDLLAYTCQSRRRLRGKDLAQPGNVAI